MDYSKLDIRLLADQIIIAEKWIERETEVSRKNYISEFNNWLALTNKLLAWYHAEKITNHYYLSINIKEWQTGCNELKQFIQKHNENNRKT